MNFVKFSLGPREENNSVLWGAEERSLLISVLQKYVFVVFFCLFVFVWSVLPPESKNKHCSHLSLQESLKKYCFSFSSFVFLLLNLCCIMYTLCLCPKSFEDKQNVCLIDVKMRLFLLKLLSLQCAKINQEDAASKCWWIPRLFDSELHI